MAKKEQTIEEQAPTVDVAVRAGLAKLGLPKDRVEIEVVDEGRRGVLGIGGREAVVRLHVKTEQVIDQTTVPVAATEATAEPKVHESDEPAPVTAVPEPQPEPSARAADEKEIDEPQDSAVAVEVVESLQEKMNVEAKVEASISPPDDLSGRRITVLYITGVDLGLLFGPRGASLVSLPLL